MKILVTGATGFLGGALVPLLVQDGHQVRVVARGEAPEAQKLGCDLLKGDPQVTDRLSSSELEGLFDLDYHFRRIDVIFDRVFGPTA